MRDVIFFHCDNSSLNKEYFSNKGYNFIDDNKHTMSIRKKESVKSFKLIIIKKRGQNCGQKTKIEFTYIKSKILQTKQRSPISRKQTKHMCDRVE